MLKKIVVLFILFFSFILSGCGGGVEDTVFHHDNKEKVVSEVGKSNLGKKDKNLFSKALDDKSGKYEGKTVGEMISDQKKIIEDRKKLEEEMKKMLIVSFGNKVSIPKDTDAWRFDDYVSLDFVVTNNSQKDIQGYKGKAMVDDIFGDRVIVLSHKNDELLKAGETKSYNMYYEINPYIDSQLKFFNTSLDKLKITWDTTAIVFADGTSIGDANKK